MSERPTMDERRAPTRDRSTLDQTLTGQSSGSVDETLAGESHADADRTRAGDVSAGWSTESYADEEPSLLGTTWGRYEIVRRVGRGAFGAVFEAHDPKLGRRVALKILYAFREGSSKQAQLVREAQAMAQVAHPNIVTVHDVGVHDGRAFVAMELVDGVALGKWMREVPRSWKEIVDVFAQAGRGLAAAHAEGLVHRDFKPDNVLVGKDGRVRVMDFGLARPTDTSEGDSTEKPARHRTERTQGGVMAGTPAYMAPEQFRGEAADERSDQYAFFVSLHEALYGKRPHDESSIALLVAARLENAPVVLPPARGEPRWLRALVERGLEGDPRARWPSMHAVVAELQRPRSDRRLTAMVVLALGSLSAAALWMLPERRSCSEGPASLEAVWNPARTATLEQSLSSVDATLSAPVIDLIGARAQAWAAAYEIACNDQQTDDKRRDRHLLCLRAQLGTLGALIDVLESGSPGELLRAREAALSLPVAESCLDDEIDGPSLPEEIRAAIDRSAILRDVGRFEDAMAALDGLDLEEGSLAAVAVGLERARLEVYLDRYLEASRSLEKIYLEATERGYDHQAASAAIHLSRLHGALTWHPEEADTWVRRAESLVGRFASDQELQLELLETRANIHRKKYEFDQAVQLFEQLLENIDEHYGRSDVRWFQAQVNLGGTYLEAGKHKQAEAISSPALERSIETLGENHRTTMDAKLTLAAALTALRKIDEAKQLIEGVITALERFGEPPSTMGATIYVQLGDIATIEGNDEEAKGHFERALEYSERAYGRDDFANVTLLARLGDIAWKQKRTEEGTSLYMRAFEITVAQAGESSLRAPQLLNNLFALQARHGLKKEAEATLVRLGDLSRHHSPEMQSIHWLNHGWYAVDEGRIDEGIESFEKVLAFGAEAHPGAAATTRRVLAETLWKHRKSERERARQLVEEGLKIAEEHGLDKAPFEAFLSEHAK